MQKYKIIIKPYAKQLQKEHLKFLARVSKPAARRMSKKLRNAIKSLAESPLQHPIWQPDFEIDSEFRKMIVDKYIVVYEIVDHEIFVDYILDSRMNNEEKV